MARPKPAEDVDSIMVRPPLSVGKKIKEAAKRDGLAVGPWCAAVLEDAVDSGFRVRTRLEVVRYDTGVDQPESDYRLNEDPPPKT